MTSITVDNYRTEEKKTHEKAIQWLLWVSIVSMIMIFAGLTSAYVVRQGAGNWLEFSLPAMFWVSTAVIIFSSASMNFAFQSAKKNNYKNVIIGTAITLVLGLLFVYTQFTAWGILVDQKIFFTGKTANASGSFLYIITGAHLAHLFGGLICLITVLVKALQKKYNQNNLLGIKLCSIYWHFLDALWIYLFLFLLIIR